MNQRIEVNGKCFSKIGDGFADLKSDLIYQSEESAKKWIALTKSSEYRYYETEFNQINSLCKNGEFDALKICKASIHIGAADAKKESLILEQITREKNTFQCLLLDSSAPLLELASSSMRRFGYLKCLSSEVDVTDTHLFQSALEGADLVSCGPKLFSIFGNTVGNYKELSIISDIAKRMTSCDFLVFGVHSNNTEDTDRNYPSYSCSDYYSHMSSVVKQCGIDPEIGHFKTRLVNLQDGDVHLVEVIFEVNSNSELIVFSDSKSCHLETSIREIIVDTSCKYSKGFLVREICRIGLKIEQIWTSNSKDNFIFLCKK